MGVEPRGNAAARCRAARAPAPARAPARRGRGRRTQRLPRRSVGPPPGDAAELPDDRLRNEDGGTGGDPATERPPPFDHRFRICRPRPRPLALGPRDPRRHDIVAHDAWIEPLSRDRRARYYTETLPIGRAFGVPAARLPGDLDAFDSYVASMLAPDGSVRVSPVARELAWAVLHPPLGPVLPPLAAVPAVFYAWTLWPALALLPASVRGRLRLPMGSARARRFRVVDCRVARLASTPPGVLPANAPGARRAGRADPFGRGRRKAASAFGPAAAERGPQYRTPTAAGIRGSKQRHEIERRVRRRGCRGASSWGPASTGWSAT